jgi:two-component system NtrC family sensor kinase
MRLVPKLTLTFVVGMSVILAGNAYFRVKRELAFFESDHVLADQLIGRALAPAVAAVWKSDGREKAMALIEQANAASRLRVRWKSAEDAAPTPSDRNPATYTTADAQGESRSMFVPIHVDDATRGGLEVSESVAFERAYVRKTITDTVLTALLLGGVFTALAMVLSVWFVGRPVESLAQKARRVGQGDFSSPLHLRGGDEFTELAREMNAMCDRLGQTLRQLRHADRLATVGKLASGLAHELGIPLNVISARAEMIASGETSSAEIADYSRVIVEASDRLAGIVRQLLEFARPRDLRKATQDLRQLADQTLRLLTPLAAKKQVRLSLSNGGARVEADVDAGLFQQVLTNLLMNAIQAMAVPGEVAVRLSVDSVRPPTDLGGSRSRYVRLSVRDAGVGMTAEQMQHVFEPFYTSKSVGEGTGLGLSVAYGIARDHGGWIAVESEPGRGSEFSMFLPAGAES